MGERRADVMDELMRQAAALGASDLHVMPGQPVRMRLAGRLQIGSERLSAQCWNEWWRAQVTDREHALLKRDGNVEVTGCTGVRWRLGLYQVAGRVAGSIRLLPNPERLPADPDPDLLADAAAFQDGLVLIGGATGSGKTTTLMRILLQMNDTRDLHIITLEDPPEFLLPSGHCCICQRRIGADVPDFETGLRAALREDPDVIVLGEMRSREALATALLAAETGHLVLATVHGGDLVSLVGRMIHAFPPAAQSEVRYQLAAVLRLVMAQKLLPLSGSRILVREYAYWSSALANLVREGHEQQMAGYLQTAGKSARTFSAALEHLTASGVLAEHEKQRLRERKR